MFQIVLGILAIGLGLKAIGDGLRDMDSGSRYRSFPLSSGSSSRRKSLAQQLQDECKNLEEEIRKEVESDA